MTEKELIHYGVLGMKWGKRKGNSSLSRKQRKINSKVKKVEKRIARDNERSDRMINKQETTLNKLKTNSKLATKRLTQRTYRQAINKVEKTVNALKKDKEINNAIANADIKAIKSGSIRPSKVISFIEKKSNIKIIPEYAKRDMEINNKMTNAKIDMFRRN